MRRITNAYKIFLRIPGKETTLGKNECGFAGSIRMHFKEMEWIQLTQKRLCVVASWTRYLTFRLEGGVLFSILTI
jgi:hypothetical protein